MLMRFDPFRELAFREIDRMNQLYNEQGKALQQRTMPIDAYREGDQFVIKFDLPGVDRDSIQADGAPDDAGAQPISATKSE